MRFRWVWLLGLACLLSASLARAQLSIEITGGGEQRTPIAVVPFAGESALSPSITSIVRADLERSGLFRGLELPPILPTPMCPMVMRSLGGVVWDRAMTCRGTIIGATAATVAARRN